MPISLPRIEGTVILAFDVSNSMLAEDLEPSRIEAAKEAARLFVENQPSTIRVGVVAFSNGGLIVQQPTELQADVLAAIDRITPQGGTSVGQGIFTSLNAIAGAPIGLDVAALGEEGLPAELPPIEIEDYSSAVIVLLSDGENLSATDPLEVAQLAAEAGVRILCRSLAAPRSRAGGGWFRHTQLNERCWRDRQRTNGAYYRAEDAETLREDYRTIDLQLTVEGSRLKSPPLLAGLGALFPGGRGTVDALWFGRVP